jgi:hypothetical protein
MKDIFGITLYDYWKDTKKTQRGIRKILKNNFYNTESQRNSQE